MGEYHGVREWRMSAKAMEWVRKSCRHEWCERKEGELTSEE